MKNKGGRPALTLPLLLTLLAALAPAKAATASEAAPALPGAYTSDVNAQTWASIGIYKAWDSLGLTAQTAGQGVKVAVIDTGIGVVATDSFQNKTLDCFKASPLLTSSTNSNQPEYTNTKIPTAKSAGVIPPDRGSKLPDPTTALATLSHGSHVAGIIACNPQTPVTIHGQVLGTMTGIAPGVTLGSYNIFPQYGFVSVNDVGEMVRAAVDDGMQVINMSISAAADGDPFGFGTDDGGLESALAYAESKNVLVIAAAGNNGVDTVLRPASIKTVLSVGATSGGLNAIHHLTLAKNLNITAMGGSLGWSASPVTATIYPTSGALNSGCAALPKSYKGKIAVLSRGTCLFETKFKSAKDAGAVGVILVNPPRTTADLHLSADNGADAIIPGGLISNDSWSAIKLAVASDPSLPITISPTQLVDVPIGTLLSFSAYTSHGAMVPDLVAPGAGIISAITAPVDATGLASTSTYMIADGTSMAAPVVTAVAALLIQLHPTWSVKMLRSALIHTADTSYLKATGGGSDPGPRLRGHGVIDALAAISTTLGFATSETTLVKGAAELTVLNPTNTTITASVSATGAVRVNQSQITVPANSSATLQLLASPISAPHGPNAGLGLITVTPSTGSPIHQNIYTS